MQSPQGLRAYPGGTSLHFAAGERMPDLSANIEQAATEPKAATVDGVSATARSLDELIAADKYLAKKAAAANGQSGLKFAKLVPGSAAGTPTRD